MSAQHHSSESRQLRNVLGRFATGVTVLTTLHEDKPHGMTANAFMSASLDPPLVVVALDHRSYINRILPGAGRYGVSVLAESQEALSNHFAGRTVPGLHVRFTVREGVPLLEGAVAYLVVRIEDIHPAGDHTLYIGRVEHFEASDGRPLLFFGGKYQQLGAEKGKPTSWQQDEFSLFSIGSIDPPFT